MSVLKTFNGQGAEVGAVEFPDDLLVLDRGDQAVHEAVVRFMARRRAGTASTLHKSEVAGSGAKPWRQKGTGRARAGYRQSNVWRGGYAAFGPKPRSYGGKINRQTARLAFRRALSDRIAGGALRVVEAIELPAPKTRALADVLKGLKVEGPVIIVVERVTETLGLAARNLPTVELTAAADVNVYQLVRYPTLIVTAGALDVLKARMRPSGGAA